MSGIREEIKNSFRHGNNLTRLILINLGVYVLWLLTSIIATFMTSPGLAGGFRWVMALPSDLSKLVFRPWTLVTYMFFHQDFLHILINLIYLYFAGQIFLLYLGSRNLLNTYLLGGLAGGLLYVVSYNVFPVFTDAVVHSDNRGASAGVMAILIAIAAYAPHHRVKLFFVLNVKLWHIAVGAVLLDLVYLPQNNNAGGHLAHLGGALFGYMYAGQLKKGKNPGRYLEYVLDILGRIFARKPKVRKVYTASKKNTRSDRNFAERKKAEQDRMNEILDKISKSGYDSLSKEEKEFLFKIGQR